MRYMLMHKHQPSVEEGVRPDQMLIAEMGALMGEYVKAGKLIDGNGLGASKTRTRLTFRGGQCTVKHGPYTGEHELPSEMLLLKVRTRDEAIGWAERYGKILGDGELELGKVTEPWDLGIMPEPPNPQLQLLLIDKADAATEAGGRTPAQKAALTRLKTEMTKAGVLQRSVALAPSAKAKRLFFKNNELRMIDGPFAESKEMVGGFAAMELSGVDEAVALCKRYAAILGGNLEIDLRELAPAEDAP